MKKPPEYKIPKYSLKDNDTFVIENYNLAKPFANFFPGIAGQYGIPLWVFYVNRGQCIASFGTKDKDHAISEFFPANKSWQLTSILGFRTFLKLASNKKFIFYEPFHNGYLSGNFRLRNEMLITSYDLTIREENISLGLEIEINYFPVPDECFAALARIVKIKNTSGKKKNIQFLDGLPLIIPYGVNNYLLKKLSRTAEAWMKASHISNCAAFYKLDVDPTDRPEVVFVKAANFYASFAKPIIDPSCIFGHRLNFDYPYNFLKEKEFKYPKNQIGESKTPSAMSVTDLELKPGEEKSYFCLFGNIRSLKLLNSCLKRIKKQEYLMSKKRQNQEIIQKLQNDINTESNLSEFNCYCRQTYLDNVIRGGYPIIFNLAKNQKQVFYLYLRKHGDLERDYNKFHIQPTYFSQGNGNFRDIVQNRRSDIWFNPEIEDSNLITFLNLIQTDGFNPLIVKGLQFHLKDKENFKNSCAGLLSQKDLDKLLAFLDRPYTPGCIASFIEENNLTLNPVRNTDSQGRNKISNGVKVSKDAFLNTLMVNSIKEEDAQHKLPEHHGAGGFWTDHWFYCLDLLESYLELYPEKLREVLFEKREFKFFDNVFVVRPRREKYVIYEGKVRQLEALEFNAAKADMQNQRQTQAHWTRTDYGKGEIYQTTLITKLLCILVNKLTSLDPFGCGIEMEANKPNWYDALNGLPALLGSSICETMELKRLIVFLKESLKEQQNLKEIHLFEDLYNFLTQVGDLLEKQIDEFSFWDKSYFLKEEYRQKTKNGVSVKESEIDKDYLLGFLDKALDKVDSGIKNAFEPANNLYCAYFINEVSEYEIKDGIIYPRKFNQKRLPLFLEAQVHALKIQKDKLASRKIYEAVKKSQLYDKKLKMYKVTGDLSEAPYEIGRCRAFSRGWLENESIWLHMEYKYILELLEAGLYKEFYSEFKNILVCFQNPKQYGRSILENCSFLVSSVFSDKSLIGTGFVARLSGSTAEFLHIWRIMNVGQKPFFLNDKGKLNLRFAPVLAGWLFKKDKTYGFNFLSTIKVTYHNPARKDTFGKNSVSVKSISFKDKDGKDVQISSDTLPAPYAEQVRSRLISNIDIFLL